MQSADNPADWRKRAQEARDKAANMMDPAAKKMMLQVADNYEKIAELADRQMRRLGSDL